MKTKKTKKTLALWVVTIVMAVLFVGGMKAEAEVYKPLTPSGIVMLSQASETKRMYIGADIDVQLVAAYANAALYDFGYEVKVTNAKNKKILQQEFSGVYLKAYNNTKVILELSNSKLLTNALKVSVRSYATAYDETGVLQKQYSDWSAPKLLVPRATPTNAKMKNGKPQISWKKITGAKSYSIYLSTNVDSGYKKIGTTSKNYYTINKKLTKYKNYYYYVVANNVKVGKKKYSSSKPAEKSSNGAYFYIRTIYRY